MHHHYTVTFPDGTVITRTGRAPVTHALIAEMAPTHAQYGEGKRYTVVGWGASQEKADRALATFRMDEALFARVWVGAVRATA